MGDFTNDKVFLRMCVNESFLRCGVCSYGNRCRFAHCVEEQLFAQQRFKGSLQHRAFPIAMPNCNLNKLERNSTASIESRESTHSREITTAGESMGSADRKLESTADAVIMKKQTSGDFGADASCCEREKFYADAVDFLLRHVVCDSSLTLHC